jgi:CheY-like chemotaxis protein
MTRPPIAHSSTVTDRKRILLVDDDPVGAQLTIATVSGFGLGVEFDVTEDGEAALNYLFRRGPYADRAAPQPNLVLLDLQMPNVGGHEVLQEIRSIEHLRDLPVIMLTSSNEDADRQRSHALGCDGYVVKSLDVDEVVNDLRKLPGFWRSLGCTPPA